MIDSIRFKEIIDEIVIESLHTEKEAFDIAGEEIILSVIRNEKNSRNYKIGEFQFLDETKVVLDFIKTIISIYEIIKDLLSKRNKKKKSILKSSQESILETEVSFNLNIKLIRKGMSNEKAEEIIYKHKKRITEFINQSVLSIDK